MNLCALRLCVRSFAIVAVLTCGQFAWCQQPAQMPISQRRAPSRRSRHPSKHRPPLPTDKPKSPAADQLSVEQARLADRFKRLEEVIGRLAELSAPTDPRRAKLLREAIAQSREQDVNTRFESIVKLLQDERLSAASTNQTELQKELDALLGLLLKADRDKELSSQRERIHNYIKEVDRIIRMQKGVRARTEGGDELKGLGSDQQKHRRRHRQTRRRHLQDRRRQNARQRQADQAERQRSAQSRDGQRKTKVGRQAEA